MEEVRDSARFMHMRVLIDAGFVATEERWRGKRRATVCQTTTAGRAAFDAHVHALKAITRAAGGDEHRPSRDGG